MQTARWLLRLGPRPSPKNSLRAQVVVAAVAMVLAGVPLRRYYAVPKQDYLGALGEVHDKADPEDEIVAADLAGRAITAYYDSAVTGIAQLEDLLRVEASGHRVWVITTLERVMAVRAPQLLTRLHQHYRRVRVLPGTVGDGAMRIYVREGTHRPAFWTETILSASPLEPAGRSDFPPGIESVGLLLAHTWLWRMQCGALRPSRRPSPSSRS